MILFWVGVQAHVKLEVFDHFGGRIAALLDGEKIPGEHRVPFPGANLPMGFISTNSPLAN